jgi:hypothetical protein
MLRIFEVIRGAGGLNQNLSLFVGRVNPTSFRNIKGHHIDAHVLAMFFCFCEHILFGFETGEEKALEEVAGVVGIETLRVNSKDVHLVSP